MEKFSSETQDVLESALTLPNGGIATYYLSGSSYNGTVPTDNYKYGTAIAMRRFNVHCMVVCFSVVAQEKPAINYWNGSAWGGWHDLMGNAL